MNQNRMNMVAIEFRKRAQSIKCNSNVFVGRCEVESMISKQLKISSSIQFTNIDLSAQRPILCNKAIVNICLIVR